jgi:hypothetical protein
LLSGTHRSREAPGCEQIGRLAHTNIIKEDHQNDGYQILPSHETFTKVPEVSLVFWIIKIAATTLERDDR